MRLCLSWVWIEPWELFGTVVFVQEALNTHSSWVSAKKELIWFRVEIVDAKHMHTSYINDDI